MVAKLQHNKRVSLYCSDVHAGKWCKRALRVVPPDAKWNSFPFLVTAAVQYCFWLSHLEALRQKEKLSFRNYGEGLCALLQNGPP